MITVCAVRPKEIERKYFHQTCSAFRCGYEDIENVSEIKTDREVIIFYPDKSDCPDWIKLEDFNSIEFTHPEEAYYVFGEDAGDLAGEIEKDNPKLKNARFVTIPCKEGLSMHAVIACAIALYDLFMVDK